MAAVRGLDLVGSPTKVNNPVATSTTAKICKIAILNPSALKLIKQSIPTSSYSKATPKLQKSRRFRQLLVIDRNMPLQDHAT